MSTPSVRHDTFVLERVYPKPPARVFAALADPAVKRRWFAEGEHHDVELFEMDFREGGAERLRYRLRPGTPFPGAVLVNDAVFQDIATGRRVVATATMSLNGRRISTAITTFDLIPQGAGTLLRLTFQSVYFEGADGPTIRAAGWGKALDRLAHFVD